MELFRTGKSYPLTNLACLMENKSGCVFLMFDVERYVSCHSVIISIPATLSHTIPKANTAYEA